MRIRFHGWEWYWGANYWCAYVPKDFTGNGFDIGYFTLFYRRRVS